MSAHKHTRALVCVSPGISMTTSTRRTPLSACGSAHLHIICMFLEQPAAFDFDNGGETGVTLSVLLNVCVSFSLPLLTQHFCHLTFQSYLCPSFFFHIPLFYSAIQKCIPFSSSFFSCCSENTLPSLCRITHLPPHLSFSHCMKEAATVSLSLPPNESHTCSLFAIGQRAFHPFPLQTNTAAAHTHFTIDSVS